MSQELKDMADDKLFEEFRSIFNYARIKPEQYKGDTVKRSRMRSVVDEMKLRGIKVSGYGL